MKKLSIILCVVILLSTVLCACGADSIVGSWSASVEGTQMTLTFEEDGTGTISALGGLLAVDYTYEVKSDVIKLTPVESSEDLLDANELPYTLDKDTLTITDGDDTIEFSRDKD